MTADALKARSRKSLAIMARRRGIDGWHSMTKDELVRGLLRLARSKRPLPAVKRNRTMANGARRPTLRNGRAPTSAARKRKAKTNGHLPVVRSRDLCTIEVE